VIPDWHHRRRPDRHRSVRTRVLSPSPPRDSLALPRPRTRPDVCGMLYGAGGRRRVIVSSNFASADWGRTWETPSKSDPRSRPAAARVAGTPPWMFHLAVRGRSRWAGPLTERLLGTTARINQYSLSCRPLRGCRRCRASRTIERAVLGAATYRPESLVPRSSSIFAGRCGAPSGGGPGWHILAGMVLGGRLVGERRTRRRGGRSATRGDGERSGAPRGLRRGTAGMVAASQGFAVGVVWFLAAGAAAGPSNAGPLVDATFHYLLDGDVSAHSVLAGICGNGFA